MLVIHRVLLSLLLCLPAAVEAVVLDKSATGFTVSQTVQLARISPQKAYQMVTGKVRKWWLAEHTWSGDAANISIDPHAGGCFCERLSQGGSVEHMRVVYAAPGVMLRMQGALGPLQAIAAQGSMSWQFSPSGDAASGPGTQLVLTYSVAGYFTEGVDSWAESVDKVLTMQLHSLQQWAEAK